MDKYDDTNRISPENGHKLSPEEAEAKVAAMLAQASSQNKRSKKKSSLSSDNSAPPFQLPEHKLTAKEAEEKADEIFSFAGAQKNSERKKINLFSGSISADTEQSEPKLSHKEAEEKIAEIVAMTNASKNTADDTEDGSPAAQKISSQEAEKRIAEIFSLASEKNGRSSPKAKVSVIGTELTILEISAFFLFILTMDSGMPGPLSPFAIFMPVFVGMGYRIIKQQLSLREAASKCKMHIFIAVFAIVIIMMSV